MRGTQLPINGGTKTSSLKIIKGWLTSRANQLRDYFFLSAGTASIMIPAAIVLPMSLSKKLAKIIVLVGDMKVNMKPWKKMSPFEIRAVEDLFRKVAGGLTPASNSLIPLVRRLL